VIIKATREPISVEELIAQLGAKKSSTTVRKVLDYLKNQGLVDPSLFTEIKKHLRRGRTKLVLNESLTSYDIYNY
jgi:Fe2+ or Zn2+ uptake regulation protein